MANTRPITLHAPRRHHVRWVSLRKWCEYSRRWKTKHFSPDWIDYDHCDLFKGRDELWWLYICSKRDKCRCPRVNGGTPARPPWVAAIVDGKILEIEV